MNLDNVTRHVIVAFLYLFLVVCALSLGGCGRRAEAELDTSNREIKVERLFEHDGCTVYRFHDAGTRYFAKCPNAGVTTSWSDSYKSGKTTVYEDHFVPTL